MGMHHTTDLLKGVVQFEVGLCVGRRIEVPLHNVSLQIEEHHVRR